MILKFQTGHGWEFIDKVDCIQTVIEKIEGKEKVVKVIVWKIENGIKVVDSIIELRNEVYDVYLLNNEGKTIERIN